MRSTVSLTIFSLLLRDTNMVCCHKNSRVCHLNWYTKIRVICGLLWEELAEFLILTADINVISSLLRTGCYFTYNTLYKTMTRSDRILLLTSKSSSSVHGGCSFVFSVFEASLSTFFPVEKKKKKKISWYFSTSGCLNRIILP